MHEVELRDVPPGRPFRFPRNEVVYVHQGFGLYSLRNDPTYEKFASCDARVIAVSEAEEATWARRR